MEENQQNVKNELFVNTIPNSVSVRHDASPETRLPSEMAPSILPKSGASSALSEAPEDRHTCLFLFEDKVRVIWTGVGTATGRAACRAQYEMPLGTRENFKLPSSRGGLAHGAQGEGLCRPTAL